MSFNSTEDRTVYGCSGGQLVLCDEQQIRATVITSLGVVKHVAWHPNDAIVAAAYVSRWPNRSSFQQWDLQRIQWCRANI